MVQNYGLGRGLSSLIPKKKLDSKKKEPISSNKDEKISKFGSRDFQSVKNIDEEIGQKVYEINVNKILTNPYQPRINFDKNKLAELSDSIKTHGIIQPLIVSKKGEEFELVAGERRLQAAKSAEMEKVPVIIKKVDNKEKLELAIIENIQRHDLNPIEEAKAYHNLIDKFKMSQEEVAKKMGKSRSTIANKIRLLNLSIDAVKALNEDKITEGHAKAILSLENKEKQKALLELILKNQLTVRQTENKIKEVLVRSHKRQTVVDPKIKDLEDRFSLSLGAKVKVKKVGGKGGRIMIDYYSEEELSEIIQKIEN